MRHGVLVSCLALALILWSRGTQASSCIAFDEAAPRHIEFREKRANMFEIGETGLTVMSDSSISILAVKIPEPLKMSRFVSWSWAVTTNTPPTNLTTKGGDDRPAAMLVAFEYDPDQASFAEALARPFYELMAGETPPGRVISYTAGGLSPPDTLEPSPFGGRSHYIMTLHDPSSAAYPRRETIDLDADYRRAFSGAAYRIDYIGFLSDTDDTATATKVRIENLCLSG